MSVQNRPSLRRVISDTSRIITSNSIHFAALSLFFIFPISLFNIIHTLILPPSPSPSPSPFDSQYPLPSFNKSQILPQLLYFFLFLIFNLFAASSITHSTIHAYHAKPLDLPSSLKSILSSFLPLLANKATYFTITAAILLGFGICMGLILMGLMALGLEIEIDPTTTPVIAVAFVMAILLVALLLYLGVKWWLMDPIIVAENKCGFAPFKRSSSLVKGARRVPFFFILVLAILQGILLAVLGGCAGRTIDGAVVLRLVVYAGLSTVVLLFRLAAKTVLFVHCKEFNGELEMQSDVKKLGQVYVQLPLDVVDEV